QQFAARPWIPAFAGMTGREGALPPHERYSVLDVEAEVEDVPVLDDIFLSLGPHLAGFLGALLAAAGDEILIGDGLAADEAALEIRMDDAGRLRGAGAAVDSPGPRFLRPHGEEGDEVEQLVARMDDTVEAGLFQPEG